MAPIFASNEPRDRDPLNGGFYTIPEAARILGIENTRRLRGWLSGDDGRAGPVIERDYKPFNRAQDISFLDLLELRFIAHFRGKGVSLQSIRLAAKNARWEFRTQHPFAMSNVKFVTDRKRIFLHSAQETGDDRLLDMVRGQFTMYEVIEQILAKGVGYDPATDIAEFWHPKLAEFPNVVISPFIAFGQPSIEPHGVPTAKLFELWHAEEGDYGAVSEWFEVERDLVEQAVEYELAAREYAQTSMYHRRFSDTSRRIPCRIRLGN